MHFFPFVVLGLVNGVVVGLAVALVARGIASGAGSLRFRDAALLGMAGSLAGSILATAINSQDGYLAVGPSSLLFSVVGAGLLIGGVSFTHLSSRRGPSQSAGNSPNPRSSAYESPGEGAGVHRR